MLQTSFISITCHKGLRKIVNYLTVAKQFEMQNKGKASANTGKTIRSMLPRFFEE